MNFGQDLVMTLQDADQRSYSIVGRGPRPTAAFARCTLSSLDTKSVACRQRQLERRQQREVVAGRSDSGRVVGRG